MPLWCAVVLCIVNCVLPGVGTMIAGFTVLCCANPGDSASSNVRSLIFVIIFFIVIIIIFFVFLAPFFFFFFFFLSHPHHSSAQSASISGLACCSLRSLCSSWAGSGPSSGAPSSSCSRVSLILNTYFSFFFPHLHYNINVFLFFFPSLKSTHPRRRPSTSKHSSSKQSKTAMTHMFTLILWLLCFLPIPKV